MASDERRGTRDAQPCEQGWEALRGDTLGWLLDPSRPNLHWRVLVDLIGRPGDSPAVRRARSGANAVPEIAAALAELAPDGSWTTDRGWWAQDDGPGWRLLGAVQLGADPGDPRLHAASDRLLETAPGRGGLNDEAGELPDPIVTARALEGMVALGWSKHRRVQEWLAWFDATEGWESEFVAAVAIVGACRSGLRPELMRRAVDAVDARLAGSGGNNLTTFGHPNLRRTDLAEVFAALARAGVEWRETWQPALRRLQRAQDASGCWDRIAPAPDSLGGGVERQPSKWVTFKAVDALLSYAVVAELPRMFPQKPPHLD